MNKARDRLQVNTYSNNLQYKVEVKLNDHSESWEPHSCIIMFMIRACDYFELNLFLILTFLVICSP